VPLVAKQAKVYGLTASAS